MSNSGVLCCSCSCLTQILPPFAKEFNCPATAINICSSDYSCSLNLPLLFLYNLIFFKEPYFLSIMLLHFPWIFFESQSQWSSCDSQEKLTYSSKENANSSLSALFTAVSNKYLYILHSYFSFVFALYQLASGFLFFCSAISRSFFLLRPEACNDQMQKSCFIS